MPANPTADSGGGWRFDFPSRDGVHYLVTPVTGFINGAFRADMVITAGTDAVFRESDPCDHSVAAFRPYLQRAGDKGTAAYEDYRWWGQPTKLAPGEIKLEAPLDPGKWSQVFGRSASERPAAFQAAISNPQAVGLTFGGCFAGHGVYVTGGTARFIVRSFSVD